METQYQNSPFNIEKNEKQEEIQEDIKKDYPQNIRATNSNTPQKILINIGGIIIIVAVLFLLFRHGKLFNPELLTYKNSIYGFKIQYPIGWIQKDLEDFEEATGKSMPVSVIEATLFNSGKGCNISLTIETLSQRVTIEEYAEAVIRDTPENMEIIEFEKSSLASYPAYKIVAVDKIKESKYLIVSMIKYDKLYEIYYFAINTDIYDECLETADKVINSFEFL
jgi:hypothetical protein